MLQLKTQIILFSQAPDNEVHMIFCYYHDCRVFQLYLIFHNHCYSYLFNWIPTFSHSFIMYFLKTFFNL